MEIKEEKVVDMLTKDSVSIITKKFIDVDGIKTQVGENHRCAYVNSEFGRKAITESEPEDVVSSVMAIWGDTPTIEKPTTEETENSKQMGGIIHEETLES